MSQHWEFFEAHRLDHKSYVQIGREHSLSASRVQVQARRGLAAFEAAFFDLLAREGIPRSRAAEAWLGSSSGQR